MPARLPHRLACLLPVILGITVVSLASRPVAAQAPVSPLPEYRVKAAFLLSFARFVEWPKEAFDGDTSPFVIAILGSDPFGPELEEALRGKTVHGRGLVVRRSSRASELGRCQLLFLAPGGAGKVQNKGVLTVSEEGRGRGGAMIRFLRQDGRVRFEVDLAAAKSAGLTLSSKLLRVGKLVTPDGGD
jgi:YfiR/HmsC-like